MPARGRGAVSADHRQPASSVGGPGPVLVQVRPVGASASGQLPGDGADAVAEGGRFAAGRLAADAQRLVPGEQVGGGHRRNAAGGRDRRARRTIAALDRRSPPTPAVSSRTMTCSDNTGKPSVAPSPRCPRPPPTRRRAHCDRSGSCRRPDPRRGRLRPLQRRTRPPRRARRRPPGPPQGAGAGLAERSGRAEARAAVEAVVLAPCAAETVSGGRAVV